MNILMRHGSEKMNCITGTILAGGAAKRFNGMIKSKIVIGGRTIISRIIGTFDDIFDKILIVTNTPDEYIEYRNNRIVEDQFLFKGPLGGIHAALSKSETDEIFVVAGDMPLLDKELILKQIDFFYKNKCDILIPVFNDFIEPLHGIYCRSILTRLEEYLRDENDYSMREFFTKCNVLYFQTEETDKYRRAFTNINSPLDVEAVERLLESEN